MEGAACKGRNPTHQSSVWLPMIIATGAALVWLYLPHMISMVNNWWIDPNYSHGFLVPHGVGLADLAQTEPAQQLMRGPELVGAVAAGSRLAPFAGRPVGT